VNTASGNQGGCYERVARRKLLQLHAVTLLASLKIPPGNQLEALKGDRKSQYSIRINDQWRVCFKWRNFAGRLHETMGISGRQLSADIDVSPSRISGLVRGQRPISADTALRLGIYFRMEPRFWINLQTEYDIRIVARELQDKITPRIRVFQANVVQNA
jgi:addiction module HigA family antidote